MNDAEKAEERKRALIRIREEAWDFAARWNPTVTNAKRLLATLKRELKRYEANK